MKQKSFVSGAVTLLVSGIIVKLLGALFKIPLTNLIGDSGMGLFSFAMQFFTLLFVITAAGLPIAVSHLVSESIALDQRRQAQGIAVYSGALFGGIALILSGMLVFYARPICLFLGERDAIWCVIAIAPALFFVTVEAALRGWYQGTGNMMPTAVSQIAEAVGKLTVGLFLARKMLDAGFGIRGAAVGAVLGVTCGELFAATYLLWSARRSVGGAFQYRKEGKKAFPHLVQLMIPVTLSAAVMTVSGFLDMAVIYRRLPDAGLSAAQIVAAYGAYTGMALTLFNLPQALSGAVSVSVLPALSAACAKQNHALCKRLVMSSMRLTLLVCIPCGAGLAALSQPLLQALFAAQPRGVAAAAPLLQLLGTAEPIVGLATVTTAVLQSFGRPDLTVYAAAVGCTAKFAVSYALMGDPAYQMRGAPIGTLVCYSLIFLLQLCFIAKLMHWMPPVFMAAIRPTAASVSMAAGAASTYPWLLQYLSQRTAIVLTVLLAIPVYTALMTVMHAWEAEDILPLPGGKKLARILKIT